jgi:ferrous iron transport protein B
MMLTLIALFLTGGGILGSLGAALWLAGIILLAIAATFLSSYLLSKTVLGGTPSPLTLELPPYRRPKVGQILWRSLCDRTLFVLGRAVKVAAPAGLVIWLLANISVGELSLLSRAAAAVDPVARVFGLDGVILIAFILALPANEIALPLMLMGYTGAGVLSEAASDEGLRALLLSAGWDTERVLCVLIFCLMHWPCSTTLLTIRKESGSWGWTLLAALLPTAFGLAACLLINLIL